MGGEGAFPEAYCIVKNAVDEEYKTDRRGEKRIECGPSWDCHRERMMAADVIQYVESSKCKTSWIWRKGRTLHGLEHLERKRCEEISRIQLQTHLLQLSPKKDAYDTGGM